MDKRLKGHIKIFSKPDCPYCEAAKRLLDSKDLGYDEFIIGSDLTREDFLDRFPNVRTVPFILFGNRKVGGYEKLVELLGDET